MAEREESWYHLTALLGRLHPRGGAMKWGLEGWVLSGEKSTTSKRGLGETPVHFMQDFFKKIKLFFFFPKIILTVLL